MVPRRVYRKKTNTDTHICIYTHIFTEPLPPCRDYVLQNNTGFIIWANKAIIIIKNTGNALKIDQKMVGVGF